MKNYKKKIQVCLPENRSHSIYLGKDIVSEVTHKLLKKRKGIIVYDRKLTHHALDMAKKNDFASYALRVSEEIKGMDTLLDLYHAMAQSGLDRHSVLVAMGGGVVGDLAGFAASTYHRGIDWIGIPTTLLGQVDSGIGGKTGLNLSFGKNLVGAFHQPKAVICDMNFLKSLSKRDIISGYGEVIKYGLIFDLKLYSSLENYWDSYLKLEPTLTLKAIQRSVELKASIVEKDEFDRKGLRQCLNFGHTLGHALESATNYRYFKHGEAVVQGMRLALLLSFYRGWLSEKKYRNIEQFLATISLPGIQNIELTEVLKKMRQDKKKKNGKTGFILLKDIGKTVIDDGVTESEIKKALRELQ